MSDLQIMCPVSAVVLVGMFIGWLCRRRPYRDGRRASTDRPPEPPDAPPPGRTRNPETHAEWNGVPRDPGLDYGRLNDALNRQDTSVTDHRDQDDDHPGPSWGIIR
jgi:hypothetical protein